MISRTKSAIGHLSLAHLTLPTQHVEKTAAFLETTLGFPRDPIPDNSPVDAVWLNIGGGQQMHVFFVEGFELSTHEGEFGRHVALFYRRERMAGLKEQLRSLGAETFEPLRASLNERFFFREPVNGYVFEIIARD